MSDGVVSRGRFKGKKITFASTARVEEFAQVASEFMGEIFDLLPGEYAISDESDIRDFTEFGSSDTFHIWTRIKEVYGVDRDPDVTVSALARGVAARQPTIEHRT